MSTALPARARFAPSPTGRFHIGGARTALYDFLLARQTGGQFILRIEDTDQKRFDPRAEQEIIDSLHWLGILWDEGPDVGGASGPYRQSERKVIYARYAEELIDRDKAYPCFCSPERLAQMRQDQQKRRQPPRYDGLCRRLPAAEAKSRRSAGESYVIRFKTPREGQTTAIDLIRGPIVVQNADMDDYILMKSNGLPVYHLAAMVDDHEMHITHVLRSSEWLPTFPLHVLIYEAFDWEQPVWVHLSVFLNPSGKGKMSKRHAVDPKGGVNSIYPLDMKDLGYLPEAVVNWLALMGWSFDDHTELFSLGELIQRFSLAKLTPSPAAVNFSKLDHFNGVYIRALGTDELAGRVLPFFEAAGFHPDGARLRRIAPLIQERIHTLDEAVEIAGFFFQENVDAEPSALVGKDMTRQASAEAARRALGVLESAASFADEPVEAELRRVAQDLGLTPGQLFGLLRIAVTGQPVSPPLLPSMDVIGKELVLARVAHAVEALDSSA
jgi:glutamyl-tRNA synthetase